MALGEPKVDPQGYEVRSWDDGRPNVVQGGLDYDTARGIFKVLVSMCTQADNKREGDQCSVQLLEYTDYPGMPPLQIAAYFQAARGEVS